MSANVVSQQQQQQQQGAVVKSSSKTVTDTLIGTHEHTVVGYSLIKGIGDGEPIASERFTVGGHEWVSAQAGCGAGRPHERGMAWCAQQRPQESRCRASRPQQAASPAPSRACGRAWRTSSAPRAQPRKDPHHRGPARAETQLSARAAGRGMAAARAW